MPCRTPTAPPRWIFPLRWSRAAPLRAPPREEERLRLAREEQTDGEQKAEDVPVGIQAVEPMVEGVDEKAVLMTEKENIAHSTPKIDKKISEPVMSAANVQPVTVAPLEPKVDAPRQ